MRLLQQIAAVHVVITVQARSSGESALSARCAVPVLLHCTLPWRKDAARCGSDKPQMRPTFCVTKHDMKKHDMKWSSPTTWPSQGVTFDCGGLNIKAGAGSMIEMMKFDMVRARSRCSDVTEHNTRKCDGKQNSQSRLQRQRVEANACRCREAAVPRSGLRGSLPPSSLQAWR